MASDRSFNETSFTLHTHESCKVYVNFSANRQKKAHLMR